MAPKTVLDRNRSAHYEGRMATHQGTSRLIADYETAMAGRPALCVLDTPRPPLWMIFDPVIFVFFAQKMRQPFKAWKAFRDDVTEMDACVTDLRRLEGDAILG